VAVDQETQLTSQLLGKFHQPLCQLSGTTFGGLDPAAVKPLQRLELTLPQASKVAVDILNGGAPLDAGHVVAGIHVVNLTGNTAGQVAAQIESRFCHLFLGDVTMQWRPFFDGIKDLFEIADP